LHLKEVPMRRSLAALPLVLALSACGTTVPRGAATGSPDAVDPSSYLQSPASGPATGPLALVPQSGGTTSVAPEAPPTAAAGAGVPLDPAAPPVAGYGPGVTDKALYVGIMVKVNAEQANAAAGAAGVSTGDEELGFRILIDEVNAHGGIAGRRVVPVFHKVDASTTQTNDEIVRAMCADWTEDHHVFATLYGGDPALLACLDKAQSVVAYDNLGTSAASIFQKYRYYAEVSLFNVNRLARAEVQGLAGQGWFAPWNAAVGAPGGPGTKVGVLTYDDPSFKSAVTHDLLPALAKQGHASVSTVYVRVPQSTAELSGLSADIANAILKLRQAGAEHVVLFDASGTLTLLFLNAAQAQQYFPRYGINSQNAVQLLMNGGNIQKQQLVGSQGIGWFPVMDVADQYASDSGPDSNAARRRCLDLYRRHQVTFADANAKAVALLTCNSMFFLKAAVERGTSTTPGVISRDTFLAGVNALGTSFESAMTFSTRFGPTKHDGASAYRPLAYDGSCGCVHYTGPRQVVP
jgi:hypothetical protein